MIKTAQVLEYSVVEGQSGASKKKWIPVKETTLRLFETTSTKIVNSVNYETADYIALSFLHDITKKNRIRIDNEDYTVEGHAIMGTINQLILKKVVIDSGK